MNTILTQHLVSASKEVFDRTPGTNFAVTKPTTCTCIASVRCRMTLQLVPEFRGLNQFPLCFERKDKRVIYI